MVRSKTKGKSLGKFDECGKNDGNRQSVIVIQPRFNPDSSSTLNSLHGNENAFEKAER